MKTASSIMQQAREAQLHVANASLRERLQELKQWRLRIGEMREEIVASITAETGKAKTDALVSEIFGVVDYLAWLVSAAPKILDDEKVRTPLALMGKKSRIWYEPKGVVLVISPWNYPFHIAATTVAAAFAAGNSVVLKPSEYTLMKGVLERTVAGLPLLSRALTVAYGDSVLGAELVAARPDYISFTGSAKTGRSIAKTAAELLIPVDLELGGKDAMVVFEDVNIQRTAAGALWGGLTNGGQSCTAVEKLYVQRSIYPQMLAAMKEGMAQLVVAGQDKGDADIGAITTPFQREIILKQLEDARAKGAVVIGGEVLGDDTSQLVTPALVTEVTDDMLVMQQETFGPVIAMLPFDTEEEIVSVVNSSIFALSASVWSKDLARAKRVAAAMRCGAVSINNVMLTEANPALPFGGVGESGAGRVKGAEGLRAMTRSKAVLIDKQSAKIEANWFPYTLEKYSLFEQLISAMLGGLKAFVTFAKVGTKLESKAQEPRFPRE